MIYSSGGVIAGKELEYLFNSTRKRLKTFMTFGSQFAIVIPVSRVGRWELAEGPPCIEGNIGFLLVDDGAVLVVKGESADLEELSTSGEESLFVDCGETRDPSA